MGNITFLGVEGSGKTVLTMALVNAFKAHEHEGWFLRPETRGAFRFLEQVPSELKEGTLPHQTTSLRHLAWSVVKDGEHQQTLDVLDYPGEVYRLAFLNAEDEADPEEFRARVQAHQAEIKALLGHLFQSEHIFVLFNIADSSDLAGNAKNLDAVWVTNACLDYLHRLPHKPRITLLLTQIDKYVDLEQYELDPKVYYTRHLPLIAHNFPQLDVCAVAALGAADATFGIDAILVRSLFNASAVQTAIGKIQEARRALKHALNMDATSAHFCTAVVSAIMYLASDAPHWQQILPWFIKPEKLISSNGFLDAETTEECKIVVGEFYVLLQKSKASPSGRHNLMQFAYHLSPSTSEANAIVRSIDASLRRVEQQHQQLVAERAKAQEQKTAVIGIVIALIFCTLVVIIIALTA